MKIGLGLNSIIKSFREEFFFLSNFYPCKIVWKGKNWGSVEHIFQAEKIYDEKEKEAIRNTPTAKDAKQIANKLEARNGWDGVKEQLMLQLVRSKFVQNLDLYEKLKLTKKRKLIEGNTWHDNFWGDCICEECKNIKGANKLGQILMKVREELEKL